MRAVLRVHRRRLQPRLHIGRVEPHQVPDLRVANSPLGHESADVAHRYPEPIGNLNRVDQPCGRQWLLHGALLSPRNRHGEVQAQPPESQHLAASRRFCSGFCRISSKPGRSDFALGRAGRCITRWLCL
jgi:hypothetical protein